MALIKSCLASAGAPIYAHVQETIAHASPLVFTITDGIGKDLLACNIVTNPAGTFGNCQKSFWNDNGTYEGSAIVGRTDVITAMDIAYNKATGELTVTLTDTSHNTSYPTTIDAMFI